MMDPESIRKMLNTEDPIQEYLFLSDSYSGQVRIAQTDGVSLTSIWADKWTSGWDIVKPFYKDGNVYLIEYKAGNGTVAIDRIKDNLQGVESIWKHTWSTHWNFVIPFYENGAVFLFKYKRKGPIEIGKIHDDLKGVDTINKDSITGRTVMEIFYTQAILSNGPVYLLGYDSKTGTATIHQVAASQSHPLWKGTWPDFITLTSFIKDGSVYLFKQYDEGQGSIEKIKPDLQGTDLIWKGDSPGNLELWQTLYVDNDIYLAGSASAAVPPSAWGFPLIVQVLPDLQGVKGTWRGWGDLGNFLFWDSVEPFYKQAS